MKRVVITGLGLQSSVGNELSSFRQSIMSGRSNFKAVKNPVIDDESLLIVGECENIDRKRLADRKVQKVTTKKDIIGLIAAFDALRDAGIEKGTVDPERIGIFTGAASTHVTDLEPYKDLLQQSCENDVINVSAMGRQLLGNVNPMVMMQTLMNNVLCYVSIPLDIRGVNANFMDYQAAGLRALGEGFWAIKEGRADYVVVGGVSGAPDLYHAAEGIDLGYLTGVVKSESDNLDVVRPYDANRSGTVLAEAAAFCIIESLEVAQKRGARIYGELVGFSGNSEASFHYMGFNSGEAMQRCIKDHLSRFNITELSAVYGHANGSVKGDAVDLEVLQSVFADKNWQVPLISIKGVTGETNEASAMLNIIDAIQSLNDELLPGTHNFTTSDVPLQNLLISSKTRKLERGDILVTSQGFSGINCVATVRKFAL